MRKLFVILLMICYVGAYAQETMYEGRLHEDILSLRWGGMWQYDQYLSPLRYDGQFIAVQNEWWTSFDLRKARNEELRLQNSECDWSHVGKVKIQGARLYNDAYTNMIYALGAQGGWGAHYDFSRMMGVDGLHLFIGPYLDVDLLGKELINNVNKPYSIDLCMDVKAHAGLSYSFSGKRTSYRVRYTAMTSLMGAQFVPEYGQSYYEVSEGIIGGAIGFSSVHNHLTIRQELTMDFQFPHSAWRLGVEHEYIRHHMNNLDFQREQVSLVVGCVFNYKTHIVKMK